jgi:AhpD family alkylhydroperoxidase
MSSRFKMGIVQPAAHKAMAGLDTYVSATSVSLLHQELIRIRASQINGCAYCVNSHTNNARKHGETEQRMHLVSVWKEAGSIFTEEEQLLMEMTEEVTLIHQHGLSDRLYDRAMELFGQEKTAQVIMTIVSINAWNRIGVSLKMEPPLN